MNKTWKYLVAGFAAVLLIGLAAHALFRSPRQLPPPSATLEKVRIANIGIFSNYNIIADEKGFFRENGLDAQVDEYDSGATSMGALLSGKADFAIAADSVGVRNIFTHDELRILATVSSHDVWRIIARKDKGVAKMRDLKGKKIGVTRKTAGEYYLGKFLVSNGMKMQDVTLIDLSASDITAQIEDGRIDAAVIFEPISYGIERYLADGAVSWSAQGNRRGLATVYTTRAFIAEHPEAVERYVRTLVETAKWQAAHQEEAKSLLAGILEYDGAYMDHLWSEFTFAVRLDQELLVTMEDQARWNIENGLVKTKLVPDYLGYIYFPALEKADPSSITVIHQP